jgi:membrane-bound lytic murein transglycosylase A
MTSGMKALSVIVSVACFVAVFAGCKDQPRRSYRKGPDVAQKDYYRQLPPGALALRKITDPKDIPDFTHACSDTTNLREAIQNSINYLAEHPSSLAFYPYGEISHAQVVASLREFLGMMDKGMSPTDMNQAIRDRFDVYISVGCDDQGTMLYTGYYTPIFDASRTRTDKFAYPLYKMPEGLTKDPLGITLGIKDKQGAMTKCPPRKELEEGGTLKGLEIFWLGNPFEVYVAHVQGSARLRLPDGKMVTAAYAANNGYDYKSIAEELINDSKLKREDLSLKNLIQYFAQHPDEEREYVSRNPRFVFFMESDSPPRGSLNQPVTPLRSIATDKTIFPRAAQAFLKTSLPKREGGVIAPAEYEGWALDQDSGGAIRAPGRCDVYMGIGDEAGELAGRTMQEGLLYYIFLKPEFVTTPAGK